VGPILKLAALVVTLSLWLTSGACAATLHLIGDFDQPIFVTSDPANANELLVVERKGRVMLVDGADARLFGDLEALVSCCEGERGLLSIAVAPDFPSSGRFYAAYTGTPAAGGAEGDLHVDSFRPAPTGAGALLREPILAIGHSAFANHNGGQLELGPDGYLYISTGDGGGGGDPLGSGQSLDSLLGKILRIEPHPGAEPEIWSYGLRNPWRFSFDRANGDMVIGDVGQGEREEVDFAPGPAAGIVAGSGVNYGWNCREGFIAYPGAPESCTGAGGFTNPVFDYPHADPGEGKAHGCALTGGYVVRDQSLGDLYGRYLYADFCAGEIRSLALPSAAGGPVTDDRSEGLDVPGPSSFGEDSCGRLYVVANGGPVYRLEGALPADCPEPLSAAPGSVGPPTQSVSSQERNPSRVLLRATRHRLGHRLKLILTARISPCAGHAGDMVQLNRGGERLAAKQLDSDCIAHFPLRIARRSTFRALLASGGYRSQVLTIALAKPRP
jgi:hypothetical protein